jgi:hypothetical protein
MARVVAGYEVPDGISDELAAGIQAYRAHIDSLGGYGTRIRATSLGSLRLTVVGELAEAGYGGCQPCIRTDDGRRFRIELSTATATREVQS